MDQDEFRRIESATRWTESQRLSSTRRITPPIRNGSGKATRLRYKSMPASGDHLVCRTWDGTTEGTTDVLVAKPYLLRESTTRTGYTYSYTGEQARTSTQTSDSSTEDQIITPAYVADDEIWAVKADTGVAVSGEDVPYIDLNLDARAWAKVAS